MKLQTILFAVNLLPLVGVMDSRADITLNYDFTNGATVPDGFGQLSDVKTLGGLSGMTNVNNVVTRLDLTSGNVSDPLYLGDLYSSLTLGNSSETQRIAVLLNRPGVDNANAFGSSLSSLNVTLDDSSVGTNVWSATSGTGTYNSDGRLSVNPNAAGVAFASGSNSLTALDGATLASNRVSLLVADFSQGGTARLAGWGVSVTGTAATSGTFTPGANASISDTGTGTTTVGATLDTTGASSGKLTINLGGTMTFSNGVTGSAGLIKAGAGELVLEGTSTYSGATALTAGKLTVNGTSASSSISVSSGATLGGSGTITGNVGVDSGAILAPGNSVGNLTTVGTTTLNTGSIFEWELAATSATTGRGTSYDAVNTTALAGSGAIFRVVLSGSQNFGEAFWNTNRTWTDLFTNVAGTTGLDIESVFTGGFEYRNENTILSAPTALGGFTMSGSNLTWTAVPEPSSALAGLLLGAGLLRRRRSA